MTETVDAAETNTDTHPYDYFNEPGMPLRPAPPRIVSSPDWLELRRRVLGSWQQVQRQPAITPLVERIMDHYWQGDRYMDPVVEHALRTSVAEVRTQLDQALARGIDSVDGPSPELIELFEQNLDRVPEWFSARQYERGRVALANATTFGGLAGNIVNTVMTTQGVGVGSAAGATGRFVNDYYRRGVETIEYFRRVSKPGSHERFSEGFATNVRVRFMHSLVRLNLRKRWGAESYRINGDPISAADMALGVPAYSTINLLVDNRLGYGHSASDLDDATAFWAYTAYIFGVPETILPRSGQEAVDVFDFILSTYGQEPSKWAPELSETFCKSLISQYGGESSKLKALINRRIMLPAVAGYFHYVCGSPVTDRHLATLGYTEKQLDRYSALVGAAARTAVTVKRILDSRPGRSRRREAFAAAGIPFLDKQADSASRQAAELGITSVTYKHHDDSTAAQFDKR